MPKVMTYKKII